MATILYVQVQAQLQTLTISTCTSTSKLYWSTTLVQVQVPSTTSLGNFLNRGVKYTAAGKNLRFSTEIAVYLRNSKR